MDVPHDSKGRRVRGRIRLQSHDGAQRVTIAFRSLEIHDEKTACFANIIPQQDRGDRFSQTARVVVDHDVQIAIVIEVCNGHATRVFDIIRTHCHGHVRKLRQAYFVKPLVAEQIVVFVPIPGQIAPKLISVKFARLILLDLRNYAAKKWQSQIVLYLACNPAIHGIDILEPIVVEVEHRRAPIPTVRIDATTFGRISERSVSVV